MTQWLRNSITSQQHCVPAPPFVPTPISIFWRHWCKFQVSKIGASASNCSPKQTNETTEAFVTESTSQQSRGIFSLCNDIPSRSLGISWSATFSRRNSRKLPIQFSLLHWEWRVESGCYDATTVRVLSAANNHRMRQLSTMVHRQLSFLAKNVARVWQIPLRVSPSFLLLLGPMIVDVKCIFRASTAHY